MIWSQDYNPLGNIALSTLVAAAPLVVLLGSLAFLRIRIHLAALLGLGTALALALWVYRMPAGAVVASALFGAAYGLFPIGWIILNLLFLYQLAVDRGLMEILRASLASLAPDPRVQAILIAFCLGAFFEGTAGFGTPVAVTAAILISLGFKPLEASVLALVANTAPVAYAGLGTPVIALAKVSDLDLLKVSAMVGRQVPFLALLVPFWMIWALAGWRGMVGVWPVALTAGLGFAIPQFLVSNFHGPWLVDIVASICSMSAVAVLLIFWRPRTLWALPRDPLAGAASQAVSPPPRQVLGAWAPWALLSVVVFLWGVPQVRDILNGDYTQRGSGHELRAHAGWTKIEFAVPHLHEAVRRAPPVASPGAPPERAVFSLDWLSATGTGILLTAVLAGGWMGFSLASQAKVYWRNLVSLRHALITLGAMMALGYVTRYSGGDAVLGIACAKTGSLYPFFGTMLGWLGVVLTGSDTASNVLFGSLQKVTAEQTGCSPLLMCAANATGGMMGKMVAGQSIVVASTATKWYGHEGTILRYLFFHSVALAALAGLWVFLQAGVAPFNAMVIR